MSRQVCTFNVGDHYFGVEVQQVQEVLRYQEMTVVPLSCSMVRGLINLRGQIVTAIDMRRRLALEDRGPDELPMNVVLRTDHGAVSMLVDEIGDVLEPNEENFELPPETLPNEVRGLICGVYKLEGKLLLLIDTGKALTLPDSGAKAA